MDSRIFKEVMGLVVLPLKKQARLMLYQSRIHGDFYRMTIYFFSFNRLDLPAYKSLEVLSQKLTWAIEETMGFMQE
jgi:hypothetical protein